MVVGIKHNTVKLVRYDKEWPKLFEKEARRLKRIFGSDAVAIEHIGSTAVQGLAAKPIIDIMVGVPLMRDHKRYIGLLESAGYIDNPYLFRRDQHIMFSKRKNNIATHHIHVARYGGTVWKNLIGVRDHLRKDRKARAAYLALKKTMQKEYASDRTAYTKSKGQHVRKLLKKLGR